MHCPYNVQNKEGNMIISLTEGLDTPDKWRSSKLRNEVTNRAAKLLWLWDVSREKSIYRPRSTFKHE